MNGNFTTMQLSYETKKRIERLQKPREDLEDVVIRALDLLEREQKE